MYHWSFCCGFRCAVRGQNELDCFCFEFASVDVSAVDLQYGLSS